jgi:hypothetical protein
MPALTAYGGEVVIRSFLYALPSLAFFASHAVLVPRTKMLAMTLVAFAVPMHFVAHYGNEVVDYVPKPDIEAAFFYRDRVRSHVAVLGIPFIGLDRIEDRVVVFKAGSLVEQLSVKVLKDLRPDTVALNENVRDTLEYFYGEQTTFGELLRFLDGEDDFVLSYFNGEAWIYATSNTRMAP